MSPSEFNYIDPKSYAGKPWTKVDGGGQSFGTVTNTKVVHNVRGQEANFSVDKTGFQYFNSPAKEKLFTDDNAVRNGYYHEVEELVKSKLPGVKKVVIFDHTIRRRTKDSPRQPVQRVHVDQTPAAAEKRVFRHLPKEEAGELAKGRFQIINVWRPIENPASDFPLALVDYRSTKPADLIPVDLMYPDRADGDDGDDRGKETLPPVVSNESTEGYAAKGETFSVAPSDDHEFYYLKDMKPEEAVFIKCFDSRGEAVPAGKKGIASYTPHTAFVDPETPSNAPGRQSIEVRCLVFYE
ncbi:hypothetical protein BT63DRAFT_375445 [Microthyrium microscopicum]|uniref:Methyltransferase n=1 Tax=Microthyrium microscopicum TaxID=703497 RepID=A0A6A6U782_9PEZI|nr:hypothetical protein BT63DRAFT_375445 [Microthyrium microscopicum]